MLCTEHILPNPISCDNNHSICSSCANNVESTCPQCCSFLYKRNDDVVELGKIFRYKCVHAGCDQVMSSEEIKIHEQNCIHDPDKNRHNSSEPLDSDRYNEMILVDEEYLPIHYPNRNVGNSSRPRRSNRYTREAVAFGRPFPIQNSDSSERNSSRALGFDRYTIREFSIPSINRMFNM